MSSETLTMRKCKKGRKGHKELEKCKKDVKMM